MPFVHSLIKTEMNGKRGWCAPVEIGEAAPHYISFVIPVDEKRGFFDEYTCEAITAEDGDKRIESHALVREGEDSFVLHLGELDLWFTIRPVPQAERCLPYLGKLQHADFAFLLAEIEPEDPDRLDRLFEGEDTFVIGCEPFAHYSGIKRPAKKR
jgi:hypothetical protein